MASDTNDTNEELAAVEALLLESVAAGHLEVVGVDGDGNLTFRLTEAGEAHVESMLGIAPSAPDGDPR